MKRTLAIFIWLTAFPAIVSAHPAWGMAVDKDRNVIFADIFHNGGTIWKLSPKGTLTSLGKGIHAHNVNVLENGDIYASHGEGTYYMLRIPADGGSAKKILSSTDETKYFGGNSAVSDDGNVYFGIRKYIWKYTKSGPVKFSDQRLEWNQAMFLDKDGSIYVPDIGVGNGTVFRLNKDGTSEKLADNLISQLDRPKDKHNDVLLGMGKDDAGNLYITETAGRRVIKIDPKGNRSTFYTASKGWKPTAITFHEGDAYVHEYGRIGTAYDFQIVQINNYGKKNVLVKYSSYIGKKSAYGQMSGWHSSKHSSV
ncbi:MAG: hypothetical protein HKN33_10105 [Pyrinomonadaceae bacterium]|nr:hypothetical protein [Pyrinomonadaceae bacterium]